MNTGNLDIKLFELIERRGALRRERNEDDYFDKLMVIDRMIATAEVETIEGLKAKCEMLSGQTTFCDADEWIMIAFALGRDAERLDIDPAICLPSLARRCRDDGFAPSQRDVDGFTKVAREFLSRVTA